MSNQQQAGQKECISPLLSALQWKLLRCSQYIQSSAGRLLSRSPSRKNVTMCFTQQGSQQAPAVTNRWLEGQPSWCQGLLDGFAEKQVGKNIATCLGRKRKTRAKVRALLKGFATVRPSAVT